MTAATDTFENEILALIFNNTAFGGIGDATGLRGSTGAGSLYVSLHTADPGEAGAQNVSEAGYTGYARVAVARSAAGWTVNGSAVANTGVAQFGAATGGTSTVTHVGIGTAATGAGKLLYRMALTNPASLAISAGIAPKFDPGAIMVAVD